MQYKKLLAMLLAVVMILGTFSPGITIAASAVGAERTSNLVQGYTDPWSTNVLPDLSAPADQNVDDVKFTHKEYTGLTVNGIHNEDVFGVNREEASVFSTTGIFYDSVEKAIAGARDYDREGSAYFQKLTGPDQADWSLTVLKNAAEADAAGYRDFYKPGYETFAESAAQYQDHNYGIWKDGLQLPASWEYYGFDYSIYTNVSVPWQAEDDRSTESCPAAPVNFNPVGLYRKTFTVDEGLKSSGGRIYLNLQGVESAYYVYVNGKEVGYSEDSFDPHSFDVTDYLVDGENLLAVKVHRFSDGTWFEMQDMYQDGGIFRDIYLYTAPLVHIEDYFVTTDLDENYVNATMNLEVTLRNSADSVASGYKVDVRLYDEDGNMFFNGLTLEFPDIPAATAKQGNDCIISHSVGEASGSATVLAPELWTAETPNLYYLVLSVYSADGVYMGSMSQQHGFREIEFTRTEVDENGHAITPTDDYEQVKINGQRLLIKGANRHETDPVYGKYMHPEVMELDVAIMKQNNINAVSTAHYTNDDYFYYLCNKYGLYVNGEPNLECHQLQSAGAGHKMALCKEMILDRGVAALEQLKNCTSLVIWEDNNECYWSNDKDYADGAMYELLWYFKNEDGTRPVVDAGNTDSSTYGMGNGADLSNHGYSERYVMEDLATFRRPWLMTEYAHSMGNATGSIYEYWEYVRANEMALGGFIWDLVDQGRRVALNGGTAGYYSVIDAAGGQTGQVQLSDERSFISVSDASALTTKAITGNSYVVFPDSAAFNTVMSGVGKSFTLETICKPASLSGNQIIVAKGDTQIAIKTNASGKLEMFGFDNNTYYTMTADVPDDWVGNWHQVVGVYDNGRMSLYVDGILLNSVQMSWNGLAASGSLFAFGYQTDERNSFDGAISMGRVYSRALTAQEIQAQNSSAPAITADDSDVYLWVDMADLDENSADDVIYYDFDYYGQSYAKETLYDNAGYFYGYGGDNGEVCHDGNFCQNGLLLPDRTVQPEMYEVKYVYQDFWFTAEEADLLAGRVRVFNETSFTDLSRYGVRWELLEDGQVIAQGELTDAAAAPGATVTLDVPYRAYLPDELCAGGEYYLNLSVCTLEETDLVPAGHEVAYAQFELPADVKKVEHQPTSEGVTIDDTGARILVSGGEFRFTVNKETGIIEDYRYHDQLLLEQGPVPNYWRSLMDNDKRYDGSWKYAAQDLYAENITVGTNEEGLAKIEVVFGFPNQPGLEQTMTYLIEASGALTISTTVDATACGGSYGRFLRLGTNLVLPAGFEDVQWYGGGPVEALNDRQNFTRVGLYETTVNDLYFPYMAANDTGTLQGVRWFTVTGEGGAALAMAAYEPLECAALHFTLEDLSDADHPYELEPTAQTHLSINYGSQGTGNAACGPDVWEEYVLSTNRVYSYAYTLIPYEKGEDVMELTRAYRKNPGAELTKLAAETLAQQIDALYVTNADQLAQVQAMMAEYEALSDYGKRIVGENRYTKLVESLDLAQKLVSGAITVGVRDQSANGFDLDISGNPDASIVDQSFRGKAQVDSDAANALFGELMQGTNPFTIEAYAKSNGNGIHNLIVSKGDECAALRFSGNNVDFFICNNQNQWVNARGALNAQQQTGYVHIVGVYDGSSISLYLDGVLVAREAVSGGVKASSYPLTLGYEPMAPTERVGTCLIRNLRIYSKPLDAQEIAGRTVQPTDDCVELWYDFDADLAFLENGEAIEATDIRTDVTRLDLEVGQTVTVAAEPVPYFASRLGWSVADPSVARVDNGKLTAVGVGETVLVITAEASGVRVEIPVTVKLAEDAVERLIAAIDAIKGHECTPEALQNMLDLYNAMTEDQRIQVGEHRLAKLMEALKLKQEMEDGRISNASDVVRDESANGFDLVLADQPDMTLENGAITGWGDVKGENADEFYHAMFSGNNPFTVDVVMNPNGAGSGPNMIFSKGDECTAMRIYGGSVHFYIFEGNDTWNMITASLSDSQLNSWIRITGVYTGNELRIYVNGSLASSAEAGGLIPSNYPLGIGYCPMYPATSSDPYLSWASFRNVHIYSRALSAQEIFDNQVTEADTAAVLWYDFDSTSNDYYRDGEKIQPTGIRTDATALQMLKGDKVKIYADAVPYYTGAVKFSVEDSSVAYVSPDGTVTAKKNGATTITLTVEGTDLRLEIPVSVQAVEDAAVAIANEAKELAQQALELAREAEELAKAAEEAAVAAANISAEDTQAAEKAAQAAAEAAEKAKTAKEASDAAAAAAQAAAEAAEESNTAAAQEALNAAREAVNAAKEAENAAAAAAGAAQAQQAAQAAQAKAEEAACAAEEAAAAAEEARQAAVAAQEETAENKEAAEAAQKSAEKAEEAAELAREKAEAARDAAEAAAEAADAANEQAARSAAEAAQYAAAAAETAKQAASYAAAAAEAQLAAQRAQAAAEAAARESEEAAKRAEEEAAARKAAAELATAKQAALLSIMIFNDTMDLESMTPGQRQAYEALLKEAITAVEQATEIAQVTAAYAELEESVKALLEASSALRFTDVERSDWFFEAVDYVTARGLMIGVSETAFAPGMALNRAQFATILYRVDGEQPVQSRMAFQDVPAGQWYSDAVLWAAEKGIVMGYGNGIFGSNNPISREQMVVMMYRYAQYLQMDTANDGNCDSFRDADQISEYALEALNWAVDRGIINGKAGGTMIDPQGTTTRAECAAIIQRFFGIS
ncbi:MAG: S-layer homology domain-containing protein [Oscillospiraceae bacterium]|nr:S-layer homology domain-containing protein [Oscillospiraceae bacterium]